jgi:hypothetical protein
MFYRLILIFVISMGLASCSIPNLQPEECTEARPAVREFFSFHFGNEMSFSQAGLALRERFLTPRYAAQLKTRTGTADPFTVNSDDVPRAFRVGQCVSPGPDQTVFDVLVFWRDSERTDQRTIRVEAVRTGDTWLIDRVNY